MKSSCPQYFNGGGCCGTTVERGAHARRAIRGLQVAVVSGFVEDCRGVQESCLALCNACREGMPVEHTRVSEVVPQTRLTMFLLQRAQTPPTRVLQPRGVLRLEWSFRGGYAYNSSHTKGPDGFLSRRSGTLACDVDLREVQWPEGTKEISLLFFDKPVQGIAWPVGLECLSFCALRLEWELPSWEIDWFDHPLDGANFPSGLREMFLGDTFNQPIEDVVWPPALERLSLAGYNHEIDNVRWPPALKSLEYAPIADSHTAKPQR